MIHQLNIYGKDKVQTAIDRLRMFEPPEGYYLAFSGGKDSIVVKALADMAGVKYDAHYNITSVDPPELVQFVKTFPEVKLERSHYNKDGKAVKEGDPVTMWNLIPERSFPPTRIARFCCEALKEGHGKGRFVVTGVRWAESIKRAAKRSGLEVGEGGYRERLDPDNPDNEEVARVCPAHGRKILNPIIDWSTDEVWEFIRENNLRYCSLYDEGFSRLGCIGCPMGGKKGQLRDFARWPKFKKMYIKAFDRMLGLYTREQLAKERWKNGTDVFNWWVMKN